MSKLLCLAALSSAHVHHIRTTSPAPTLHRTATLPMPNELHASAAAMDPRTPNELPNPALAREEKRITIIGAYANMGLSVVKAAVGLATNCNVLVVDAAHSASDLISDGAAYAAVKLSATPTARFASARRRSKLRAPKKVRIRSALNVNDTEANGFVRKTVVETRGDPGARPGSSAAKKKVSAETGI